MNDSIVEVKAFSLIKELKNGVALADALQARLTDLGCAAAHEQLQALQAAARQLVEAVGEPMDIEHYERGARESSSLCFCRRCRQLREARAAQASRAMR